MCKVSSIEGYIRKVTDIIKEVDEDTTVVYRGEDEVYNTNCQPNIFRKNNLSKNKLFEKNLFDEMSANELTDGKTYLEKAIDAQHRGFSTRLLDVSYNSLVALYFAVTPAIPLPQNEKEKEEDGNKPDDGAVYLYFIKKIFCPSGENINSAYDYIVTRKIKWLCEQEIFQKNHKLIDHIKKNKRVIAQQGAFILFQGDEVTPIPECDYQKIIIDKNSKREIQNNLKTLFGIHTGSIYPEATNLINEMTNKSFRIDSEDFNFNTELGLVINTLERELSYFYEEIVNSVFNKCSEDKLLEKINDIENIIFEYKLGFKQLERDKEIKVKESEEILKAKRQYNLLIKIFSENISRHICSVGIEFSEGDLLWEDV